MLIDSPRIVHDKDGDKDTVCLTEENADAIIAHFNNQNKPRKK